MKTRHPFLRLAVPLSALALSGCVTRGYKLAEKNVPPAVAFNLAARSGPGSIRKPSPIGATLNTVIVYRGPGSWKREAYWDEYVMTVTNRGDLPLELSSALLHAVQAEPIEPGNDPWQLEKLSKAWWESNALQQAGIYLKLGTGAAVGFGVAYAAGWQAFGAAMAGGTAGSGVAAAGAIGTAAVVVVPVIAGGTVYMNFHRKHQIEAEFSRRRFELPTIVMPGETARGSLFFRISPGPERLVLSGRAGGQPVEITIDLAPLAGLHLAQPTAAASPPPAPAPSTAPST